MENKTLTEQQKKIAFSAIESHSLQQDAMKWNYCVPDAFISSKAILSNAKISSEKKAALESALSDTEEVIIVAYYTAEERPEPLSGFGKTYNFAIHPVSNELLMTNVGTWRS